MKTAGRLLLAFSVFLAACGAPDDESPREAPRPEPVVVYASHDDAAYWPGLFAGFTRETGIRVTVKHGDPDRIVDDVIAKRGSPPADVLLAPSVAGIWRASDEGALLPLSSDAINTQVPGLLRDPDGYWTAISHRVAEIVVASNVVAPIELAHYEELARPEYKGLLCLSSAALPVNRSVIAMLIRTHGARPAEVIVRGWVANLAIPPLDSEKKLVAAIEAGTCAVGIVSAPHMQTRTSQDSDVPIARIVPNPVFIDAEAVGINRHAREPETALRLIEWMLSASFQNTHSEASGHRPAVTRANGPIPGDEAQRESIAIVGAFDLDATNLAERARYR
jgi:iron(III) transport system substrate-binding protein